MNFLTMGIFCNAPQVQLSRLAPGDRNLTWIHIAFLATVAVTPLSTALEENFIHLRVTLEIFWVNLLLLGPTLYAGWRYAVATGLPRDNVSREAQHAIEAASYSRRRFMRQDSRFAYAAPLEHCAIVMVGSLFALAPTIRWFKRHSPIRKSGPSSQRLNAYDDQADRRDHSGFSRDAGRHPATRVCNSG